MPGIFSAFQVSNLRSWEVGGLAASQTVGSGRAGTWVWNSGLLIPSPRVFHHRPPDTEVGHRPYRPGKPGVNITYLFAQDNRAK